MRTSSQKKILLAGLTLGLTLIITNLSARFGYINVNLQLFQTYIGIQLILRLATASWVSKEAKLLGQNQWLWALLTLITPIIGLIIFGSIPFLSKQLNTSDLDRIDMFSLSKIMTENENEIKSIEKNQVRLKEAMNTDLLTSSDTSEKLVQMNLRLNELKDTFNEASIRRTAILNLSIPLSKLNKLHRQNLIDSKEYKSRRNEMIDEQIQSKN